MDTALVILNIILISLTILGTAFRHIGSVVDRLKKKRKIEWAKASDMFDE